MMSKFADLVELGLGFNVVWCENLGSEMRGGPD